MSISITKHQLFIDGDSIESEAGARFCRLSPAHEVAVGEYADGDAVDVDKAVRAARRAFDEGPWPRMAGSERARMLRKIAELIERDAERLALVEVLESGKPITQARAELEAAGELWWFAATLAQHAHGDSHNALGEDYLALSLREPVGVVGMITPWNFPLLIASQKLPFALAVGCTAVVKPSGLTPGTTAMLGQLVREAGLPNGVVNVVTGEQHIGADLVNHDGVDMISFTGSTDVGRLVMASATRTLKKVALELGGKNAMVVMADADLEATADAAVFAIFFNQGECCNSASRLLAEESIATELEERIVELTKKVTVGDPLDPKTLVGAIASEDQLAKIIRLVNEGIASGAHLAIGGNEMPADQGRYFCPTVFTQVEGSMSIAQEEIFGPVLSVMRFDGLDEAVKITNSTEFGLSAGVWTSDVSRATAFAKRARVGTVWVNCWMDGFPEVSFGGLNQSGSGRELGRHAVEEFTEMKSVVIHQGKRTMWLDGAAS